MYVYKIDTQTWPKMTFLTEEDMASGSKRYDIKLQSAGSHKLQVISVLRQRLGVTEKEAKQLADAAPTIVARKMTHDKAVELKNALEEWGAEVEVLSYNLDLYFVTRALNSYPDAWAVLNHCGEISVVDFSTTLLADASVETGMERGLIVTRPLNFSLPDIYKVVNRVYVRGQFDRSGGHSPFKYLLLASNDGVNWVSTNSARGPSWKMFRIVLPVSMKSLERISYIEIDYDEKFTNRIR